MRTLNITDLQTFIQHIVVRLAEPAFIWGPPGCGKSEAIQQLARMLKARLVDIRLSQYDSVDLRGIPVPMQGGLTVWHAPSTLPFKGNDRFDETAEHIILFLDELNSASNAVAAVAYQLINDRRVGEHELMDNVRVVAAGNRDTDKGVTNRQPLPLANRFTHVEVQPDAQAWVDGYAIPRNLPPIAIAFLLYRKPLISTFDPDKPAKAFATPRTWAKAFRYYADPLIPQDVKIAAMVGAVGDGPAGEFWGFAEVWGKLIPLSEILKKPTTARLPEEMSEQYATAVNVSGAMKWDPAKQTGTTAALDTYLARMAPEFRVMAWQLAVKRDTTLFESPEFTAQAEMLAAIYQNK